MEQPSYTKQLLMQLNHQRSKGHLCDVIIVVENTLFRAHKNVLAACSSYFKCLVLQDNLITLNTQMVKPSVFQQVLDFIYTGQLSTSHYASDQGVCDLLRAASYLQLSDLAALCRRKLRPCRSSHWSSSTTTSSITTNGHLQVGYNYLSRSMETHDGLQRADLSKDERVSMNSGLEPRLQLTRESSTGSAASSLQQSSSQSSSNSSDDVPFNSTSAFYNPRLEHCEQWYPTTDSQQTAAPMRPRSSREGCLEGTKRHGELVQAEWRLLSELEDHVEVGDEDLAVKKKLQIREESQSKDKELNGNKHVSCIYHQPQPGFRFALHDTLYMCILCRKGFPSSEQLIAHVTSHTAEELRIKDAEEGTEGQDSENLPSQSTRERTAPHVTSPPRHVCSVCGQSYTDVALLRRHERSHWPTRPFSCDVCGKLFTQRGTMTRHMRSHLGLKPFACEECGMRFTRQYRKMEHMRIHSGEKAYECQICGVKFTQQRSIMSHLKMHTVVS